MNEIITKLDEIEEKAEAIISDAKSRKEQMARQLEADRREIDRKYDALEKETIERQREQLSAEAKRQIDRMREKNQAALEELDAKFCQDREKLAEQIFERIIQM